MSGSKDRGVQFWDPETGNAQMMLQGHKNSVISVAPSPTGNMFATGSGDMKARIWRSVTMALSLLLTNIFSTPFEARSLALDCAKDVCTCADFDFAATDPTKVVEHEASPAEEAVCCGARRHVQCALMSHISQSVEAISFRRMGKFRWHRSSGYYWLSSRARSCNGRDQFPASVSNGIVADRPGCTVNSPELCNVYSTSIGPQERSACMSDPAANNQ